jgi:hypothetical protein
MAMKSSLVQILVVVAAIQTSYQSRDVADSTNVAGEALKVVVDKGSLRVALMQRSVGPKCSEKSNSSKVTRDTKGK